MIEPVACAHCGRSLRLVQGSGPAGAGEWSIMVIVEGPERIGEQLFIDGTGPITIGSAGDNSIVLKGTSIASHHLQLNRNDQGWIATELEAGPIVVNDASASEHLLHRGDVLRVGPFELEYMGGSDASVGRRQPPQSASESLARSFSTPAPSQLAGVSCPSCGRSLPLDARICVDCGINLKTGRPLLTARGMDENELYARTETLIRALSWVLPFGLYPVASEAFGTRKPYVIWTIALLTLLTTILFWNKAFDSDGIVQRGQNLMLWVGHGPAAQADASRTTPSKSGEFHSWQLLTYALLNGGILKLAENMVFLLVLGSRVNALLGQLRTTLLYPLLATAVAAVCLFAESSRPLHPVVGPAGAIMGLAGVYLILFPAHRVHTVAWVRTGISSGFQLAHNVFAVPGVTVVLLYLAIDALMTLLESGTARDHWLHFAGFPIGLAAGLALLLSRQANARGGDILSMTLGRHAWPMVGRPGRRSP